MFIITIDILIFALNQFKPISLVILDCMINFVNNLNLYKY